MIAQVVFDLLLEGPFDYLIPEQLVSQVKVGSRVKVSFGPRAQMGFVIGLLLESTIDKLKPILSVSDPNAIFNDLDLNFAREFSAYYGCSLGEALFSMLRNKKELKPSIRREHKPDISLFKCHPNRYAFQIKEIISKYNPPSRFLILVPDAFRAHTIAQEFKSQITVSIGMRSSVFEADGRYDCVIMVDEEDSSFKQEQTPMYETRQVLMMRSQVFGFDIVFMGVSPSVELMALVHDKQIKMIEDENENEIPVRIVDLTNYKFVPGLISPPVRDALDETLKKGNKALLVLNRRGSYRLTRCVDCAEILKCKHCDSALIYSRTEGKFLCRHCTYNVPGNTVCPKCHKPSWKSIGIGVEQVQSELKKLFPNAKIYAFERSSSLSTKNEATKQSLPDFDILISTNAVLRFQGVLKFQVAAFIDFDAELNRLDMRSAFNAFSLALHIRNMAFESVFVQTRHRDHYVIKNLSAGQLQGFYKEELKLRKEFGFSPYKHWIKISWRGKVEKLTHTLAQETYNLLSQSAADKFNITPPLVDSVGRKRDQFRFNVMVQSDHVPKAVAFIKSALAQIKRSSRVITTINIDP